MQKVFFIRAEWDDKARVWVATSDDVPGLATEADTMELLTQKLERLVPELLEENDLLVSGEVAFELLARRFSVTQMKAPH
jgi:predicted RNase H-like HicB family nuclease